MKRAWFASITDSRSHHDDLTVVVYGVVYVFRVFNEVAIKHSPSQRLCLLLHGLRCVHMLPCGYSGGSIEFALVG
jgi:hypothetical protein